MHCDVHYYYTKFKDKLYIRVKRNKLYILEGKLNQIIVQRSIHTLAIFEGSKLIFFLFFKINAMGAWASGH